VNEPVNTNRKTPSTPRNYRGISTIRDLLLVQRILVDAIVRYAPYVVLEQNQKRDYLTLTDVVKTMRALVAQSPEESALPTLLDPDQIRGLGILVKSLDLIRSTIRTERGIPAPGHYKPGPPPGRGGQVIDTASKLIESPPEPARIVAWRPKAEEPLPEG